MATPSSSATSPSPPMAYIPHVSTPSQSTPSPTTELFERDNKKKSVQKLIARAELSSVTRSLRNRLSYASHKTPALSRFATLRDGELHSQSPTTSSSFARSNAARRKPPANTGFTAGPVPNGVGGMTGAASPLRRGGAGSSSSMSGFAPRAGNPNAHGQAGDPGYAARQGLGGHTLFTSILAPPPPQQARTILNANDPPIAAPLRPEPSPRAHGSGVTRSMAEGTRAQAKNRRTDTPSSRRKGKGRASKSSKNDVDADGDVDMKAAATLTSLLMHNRPSIAGSASSPRSSFDGSDAGSTQSYSRYPQPPVARGVPSASSSSQGLASTSAMPGPSYREITPPQNPSAQQQSTRPAPTDNEAADLMLFLATSPSPARPGKDANNAKDQAAFRALGGNSNGGLRAKGRVLFPTAPPGEPNNDSSRSHRGQPPGLVRGGDSSFTSSISSIGSELGRRDSYPGEDNPPRPVHRANTPSQLLPPPPLPPHSSVPSSPSGLRKSFDASPRPNSTQEFNINEFINASPSPSRGHHPHPGQHKVNLGLRADVGRKLFEGEQMRLGMAGQNMKRPDDRSLGAGIDLLKS